jgi:hypothetical protein
MTLFLEGQDPLDQGHNVGRMSITQQEIDRLKHVWNEQHAYDDAYFYLELTVVLGLILAVAYGLYRIRRSIAAVADKATISGLAEGVKAARAIRAKSQSFAARVVAKADEDPHH